MNFLTCCLALSFLVAAALTVGATDVYFGTTESATDNQPGIYRSKFDSKTGKLAPATMLIPLNDAGWVTMHPSLSVIYATGAGEMRPEIVAVFLDEAGELSKGPLGQFAASSNPGGSSTFIVTDRTGKLLISAQYSGSSVSVFPIGDDGKIGKCSQVIRHDNPSGVHANQEAAHPHHVAISPDNRFALVCDLGMDSIVVYAIDVEEKKLTKVSQTASVPGGGPRHMKFHSGGKFALVLNELTSSVSVFSFNSETGALTMVGTTAALTEEEMAENSFNSASEIRIHPAGKFVYTANRGHDSISSYQFDSETGELKRTGLVSVRGAWPRNFNLSPVGDFLLAACRDTNCVTVFDVDQQTGALTYRQNSSTFVPAPICVTFDSK